MYLIKSLAIHRWMKMKNEKSEKRDSKNKAFISVTQKAKPDTNANANAIISKFTVNDVHCG